jgi:uncharacterized protein (DUF1330 family)
MPCYVIAHVEIIDRDRSLEYAAAIVPLIESAGGKVLAAGPANDLEGTPMTNHNVILEFPDEATANAWYWSDDYRKIISIRHEASSSSQVAVVAGWPGFSCIGWVCAWGVSLGRRRCADDANHDPPRPNSSARYGVAARCSVFAGQCARLAEH